MVESDALPVSALVSTSSLHVHISSVSQQLCPAFLKFVIPYHSLPLPGAALADAAAGTEAKENGNHGSYGGYDCDAGCGGETIEALRWGERGRRC